MLLKHNNNQKSLRSRFSNTLRSSLHDIEMKFYEQWTWCLIYLIPPLWQFIYSTRFSGILLSWTVMLIPFPCAYKSNLSQNANMPFFADASLVCIASKCFKVHKGRRCKRGLYFTSFRDVLFYYFIFIVIQSKSGTEWWGYFVRRIRGVLCLTIKCQSAPQGMLTH